MSAETVEVPIHILQDGRQFITAQDIKEHAYIAAFVARFPDYWKPAELPLDGVVGPALTETAKP